MSEINPVTGLHSQHDAGLQHLFFDMKSNPHLRSHELCETYTVTAEQLPVLDGLSLTELRLTMEQPPEPHWHPNAGELVYNLSGDVIVSVLNPLASRVLTYPTKPGQIVYLPAGWYHWMTCNTEEARVLMIYNHSAPVSALSSDLLRLTPLKQNQDHSQIQLNGTQAPAPSPMVSNYVQPELIPGANRGLSTEDRQRTETQRVSLHVMPSSHAPVSSSNAASSPKRPAPTAKKASNIRNSTLLGGGTSSAPASSEPSVWHPAVPGLQVRIGSSIHHG